MQLDDIVSRRTDLWAVIDGIAQMAEQLIGALQEHPGSTVNLGPCCMDQPVDAVIPCPRGLMRCGRSSGVPAPAYGSGRRQQLPLRPLDARWFASAARDR